MDELKTLLNTGSKVFGFTLNSNEEVSSDGTQGNESDRSVLLFQNRELGLNCVCIQFKEVLVLKDTSTKMTPD